MPHIGPTYHKYFGTAALILLWLALAVGCGGKTALAPPSDEVLLESLVAESVETQRAATQQGVQQDADNAAYLTEAAGGLQVLSVRTLTPTITYTPNPTMTLEAVQTQQAQETPEPGTPIATLAPLNLPTATMPVVPTRQPGDIAVGLGDFDWQDTFDSGDNWSEYSTSHAQVEVSGGELNYTIFTPKTGPAWTISWPEVSNFYLEVEVRTPQVCSGKDSFGLVFRSSDPNHGYRYEFSCDGQYHMMIFDETGASTVVAWTSSQYLLAGPNQINRMGVWAEGKVVSLVINGVVVAGLPDTEYRTGRFGFVVDSENTENFTVHFDNLTFWTFP